MHEAMFKLHLLDYLFVVPLLSCMWSGDLPSITSAPECGTHLPGSRLEDADVPLMVCLTGVIFKGSAALLKSVSRPFESFAMTGGISEIWPDQEPSA